MRTTKTTNSKTKSGIGHHRLSYRDSGVDRVLADRLVDRIRAITAPSGAKGKRAKAKELRSSVGGYASLYAISKDQWIAASTDGVGTKLKFAFELGRHDTVGIDLVAMSVNDLLCVGARPLFFLDYFATGKLDIDAGAAVIRGVHEGCRRARALLVGGETAEMPGFYARGEYDLAGFAVGLVHPKKALPKKPTKTDGVRPGDLLVGLRSSGFHSNGFSLVRKIVNQWRPTHTNLAWAKTREALVRELLTPTEIYTDAVLPAVEKGLYQGLAHITGSGFLNVPRMGEHVSYEIVLPHASRLPRAYEWLRRTEAVSIVERLTTFNCGLGMIGAVRPKDAKRVIEIAAKAGVDAWVVGEVTPRERGFESEVVVHTDEGRFALTD
ncbi:MAG: phosphoribosylformylglycinamidine cyclo-ligase [Bdellovibrionales bacterium]|nr:phosphoribosylformylglycinamidine cyclo-ligase [Bdellovibrionales bacterium]